MGIDRLLDERRAFQPPAAIAASANIGKDRLAALHAEHARDPDAFWGARAREELVWQEPFTQVLDDSDPPFYKWFHDGRLNAAENCLDRHLPQHAGRTAIHWEAEDGTTRDVTYQELHEDVCRLANLLQSWGVGKGDPVVIYMPLVPEVAVAMLACARIGAIHSVVFGGFSSTSLRDRILDARARLVITADEGRRAGKPVHLKRNVDAAVAECPEVERVLVLRHTGGDVPTGDRDMWWHDHVARQPAKHDAVPVGAEHPLFILYTSGSTGRPKGIVHATAGYLLWARLTTRWVFDLKPDDVYWCTADVGWVTGHSYLLYGPLQNAATQVMYEGAPTHPAPDRFWDIVERHKVTVFYTAPTAIRALMRQGDAWPGKHDLSSLRILGTVGEPINPEAWMWYHNVIGGGRCPIVDTWWQTETGGIMLSPLPGASELHPGSCGRPLPGVDADVVDEQGRSVDDAAQGGYLVLKRPWPSMLRTIWGDPERFVATYFKRFGPPTYLAGDTAHRDKAGNYWVLGRFDDVLNVSGHRIGTMEVESALVSHPGVAEAAVVGIPHEVKGEAIYAFVVSKSDAVDIDPDALRAHVANEIGPIARPETVLLVPALPKTRSGKIMRRILRGIARGETVEQDTSTLEDQGVVEKVRELAGPQTAQA